MRKYLFMTANYVARELNYINSRNWGECHKATEEAFHGPQFSEKFEELVAKIKGLGFDAIELWVAHLNPERATPDMLEQANRILRKYNMNAVSYTAGFHKPGVSRDVAVRIFETAKALGVSVLAAGFNPVNGPLVRELAEKYDIRMAYENHPEKTPQEVVDKVSLFSPWIGSAIDTGWFATQGYDAVQAVYDLKDVLLHVHLKDIKAVGAHDTCALGDGIVDIKGVLAALKSVGYTGEITIEHEPHDYDPTEECRVSLERVKTWSNELN